MVSRENNQEDDVSLDCQNTSLEQRKKEFHLLYMYTDHTRLKNDTEIELHLCTGETNRTVES